VRIIFFGSDDFAAVHLEKLLASGFDVCACVAPPDKAKDRGMKVKFSPVKEIGARENIPVFQPETVKDKSFIEELKFFNSDLFIVIAYGKILPNDIFAIPKLFAVNVHGSLLPRYRGAAPVNWAIINGEKETGLSIIKMNAAMDAGDIIAQQRMEISPSDTAVTLREKMMRQGPEFLAKTIIDLKRGAKSVMLIVQNEQDVTWAPKLTKELGKIDWNQTAEKIHNLARGLRPWPCAYTYLGDKMLKILVSQVMDIRPGPTPGEVVEIKKDGFIVATGHGGLFVKEVHLQAAKAMDAGSFIRGQRIGVGYNFQ